MSWRNPKWPVPHTPREPNSDWGGIFSFVIAALVIAACLIFLSGCAHEVVPNEEWVVTYVSGRTEHLRRDSWYGMWFDDNGNRVFLSHVETTRRIK